MDNDICGVVVCVRNTAISIEIFDAIGEGKDGHVEVRLNVVAIPVKIYKPLRADCEGNLVKITDRTPVLAQSS